MWTSLILPVVTFVYHVDLIMFGLWPFWVKPRTNFKNGGLSRNELCISFHMFVPVLCCRFIQCLCIFEHSASFTVSVTAFIVNAAPGSHQYDTLHDCTDGFRYVWTYIARHKHVHHRAPHATEPNIWNLVRTLGSLQSSQVVLTTDPTSLKQGQCRAGMTGLNSG